MTNKLFICEKPSQARDISRNLNVTTRHDGYITGNGITVTWCLGHLLALAPPDYYEKNIKPWRMEILPIIPKKWKMIVNKHGKKQFNIVKNLLKQTKHVVIATDADREGEAIAKEILDYCSYQGNIERCWLRALDDSSIKKALANLKPGSETESLYHAATARARSDWMIGISTTMAASCLYGVNSVLSLGRVQTPTLKLVVDRDETIESFKPKDYFSIKAQFKTDDNDTFWAAWQAKENVVDEQGYCIDKTIVDNIAANVDEEPGIVTSFTQTLKKQKSPLCFSLSTLQKKAANVLGYGAKETLAIAQSLYETHKATTYPRTDCGYLPTEQFKEAPFVIATLGHIDNSLTTLIEKCDVNVQSHVWNDDKITAHHGIIPTMNDKVDISNFSEQEFNLYHLIRLHYLAQFLGDYEYEARNIELLCAGEMFKASANTPKILGWKNAFINEMVDENEKDDKKGSLPKLHKGNTLTNLDTKIIAAKTKPPARFNEGTLIEAMKMVGKFIEDEELKKILKDSSGIGTEATRANILEILFKRKYLEKKGKHIISTDIGRALIALAPHKIKDPLLTAQWEQKLDAITLGQFDTDTFVNAQVTLLDELLAELVAGQKKHQHSALQLQSNSHDGKAYFCPACNAPLRRIKNKKGNFFYGCTKYPNCKFTTWEKNGIPSL